ncbi:MAG TPA: hypothetical protein VK816_03685 [Jatrophihabitantaceae bacterium]|jgi:hypothetical protein|nr:hypothetical protein [Jatrophihabitantaceae bacterium]
MRTITRRLLLAGAGALVAGGAGITAGELRPISGNAPTIPPPALLGVLATERALIASLQVALTALTSATGDESAALLTAVLNDHVAHRNALQALLAGYQLPSTSSLPASTHTSTSTSTSTSTRASIRRAEQQAATAARAASAASGTAGAALLASIAACEAGHAELLA